MPQRALALLDATAVDSVFVASTHSMPGLSQIAERILARDKAPDRERLQRYLGVVIDQGKKLAKLIEQALDLARWEEEGLVLDR